MIKVVGVRFKKAGKVYYFDPGDLPIEKEQHVIVETARGSEYGEVVVGIKEVSDEDVIQPLKEVVRVATEADAQHTKKNQLKAEEAFQIALEKVEKHKLPMKLIDSEYTFDDSKLIFYFTADGRVDFRDLVKDLASIFKTRIELRQIGVRDEAKMIGGMGPCGRPLCCATFLGDFEPVSIRMAKEQNLSLNPAKISGICGRLMCCLKYEADTYKNAQDDFPYDLSTAMPTEYGDGEIDDLKLLDGDESDDRKDQPRKPAPSKPNGGKKERPKPSGNKRSKASPPKSKTPKKRTNPKKEPVAQQPNDNAEEANPKPKSKRRNYRKRRAKPAQKENQQ